MTKSNVFFEPGPNCPAMSVETLRRLGRTFNAASAESLMRRQDAELEEATWKGGSSGGESIFNEDIWRRILEEWSQSSKHA